jgi:hypothetical protein
LLEIVDFCGVACGESRSVGFVASFPFIWL